MGYWQFSEACQRAERRRLRRSLKSIIRIHRKIRPGASVISQTMVCCVSSLTASAHERTWPETAILL